MSTAAVRRLLALATSVWFFTPSVPELPFSGVPFTGLGLFLFVPLWVLVFVVLPWRPDQTPGRKTRLAAAGAIALKVAAGLLFIPQGLVGTYECLADRDIDAMFPRPKSVADVPAYLDNVFDPKKVPVTGSPGRPWRRLDRHVDFTNNGFSLWRDNFHLLFYTYPPTTLHPKPHVRLPADPATVFSHLDFAPLRVTWTGWIAFPISPDWLQFCPDTDGYWSVEIDKSRDLFQRGGLIAAGGPGLPNWRADVYATSDPVELPVTIRYLRPAYPADNARDRLPTRFRLRWEGRESKAIENVDWRKLFPTAPGNLFGVIDGPYPIEIPEALHWIALTGLGLLFGRILYLIDWPLFRRRPFTDGTILFLLSVLCFGIGAFETLRHGSRDSNWNTPDSYDYKIYLNRALVLWHHGDATPESRRPEGSGRLEWDFLGLQGDTAPPPEATLWRAPPPESVEFHPFGPIDWFVRKLAIALDGRLGPTTYYPDEPAVLNNRLWQFHRNPLMDYWVAGLLWMFEERLGLCYLFQVMLSAAVPWLVYGIGRRTFGREAGLSAAAVLAVDIQFTKFAYFFFAETPAAVLTALAVRAVVETRRRQGIHWYALCGLLLGLSFLMRPNLLFLLPVSAAWLLVGGGGLHGSAVRGLRLTATLAVFGFLWSLMAVRNYQLIGRPLWQATSGPTVLLIGNDLPLDYPLDRYFRDIPGADAAQVRTWLLEVRRRCFDYDNTTNREVPPIGDPLHSAAYPIINPLLTEVFRDFAMENPGHVLRMMWAKFWRLWGTGHKWWPVLHLMVMFAGAALLPWRRRGEAWLLAACIVAISLPLIVFYFEDRHRVPYLPLLHVFTGAVLWELVRRFAVGRIALPANAMAGRDARPTDARPTDARPTD